MLTAYYSPKQDGYELLDGYHSSASSASGSHTPPPLYSHDDWPSSRVRQSSLFPQVHHLFRRIRGKIIFFFIVIGLLFLHSRLRVVLTPPAYVVLGPGAYVKTLESTLQERLTFPSSTTQSKLLSNLLALKTFERSPHDAVYANDTESLIPRIIYSSDQQAAPSDWAPMWAKLGFEAKFYNDDEAYSYVEREWQGTQVVQAWRDMPRAILRADMLRYLLLYLEGGTWSDMDTVPVQNFSSWSNNVGPFQRKNQLESSRSFSPATRVAQSKEGRTEANPILGKAKQAIHAVISIECAPRWATHADMSMFSQLARHRNLQFVQWTIHFAPHHPILLDVIRRILDTTDVYRAYQMQMKREGQRIGWGWHEPKTGIPTAEGSSLRAVDGSQSQESAPWESTRQQWVRSRGHWQFGWHETSVEEWTGPAAWTDSVVSYIYATTGIRPEELAKIKEPVQVGDLVILPEDGFNPSKNSLNNPPLVTRVVHLFRGSWKKGAKAGLAN
ncbi:hypothetical protein CBS101457_003076 [Exobasidium rhododendri]|nr:hypothetical protein CBS101457_003076 [Exobasidium rhododendri]